MKKLTKVLSLVLATCMVVACFTGCGKSKKNSDTFKIGGIGPLTGGAASYGQGAMNGAQIAVDEINAAGGINGYKIEFKTADDELDNDKSVNAYNSLKDWGMQMLVGTVTSGCCTAVGEYAHEDNMFLLTPSASSVAAIAYDNAFRVCFSDPNQGIASADYIAANKLGEKIAIIYDSSDVYSSGIRDKFVAKAKEHGLNVVAEGAFNSDNNKDFSVQLQAAKNADADLVFLPIYYQQAALILTQARDAEYAPLFFGCDGLDGILGAENFDVTLAEDVVLLTPYVATSAEAASKAFTDKYVAKYNETPNQFAADAYDAVYTIKAAIEKSGATPDMSVSEICDLLKKAMLEISVDGVTGAGITWDADGEPTKAPKAMVIKNGVYEAME